jgi:hypothetical protein
MARAEFRPKFIMANGVMQNENGLKARIGRILNSRVNRNSINNKAIFIVLLALFASVGVVGTALSFSDGTYYGPADKLNEDVKLSSNSKQPSILYKNDNFVSYEKLNPQERAEVDEVIKESSIALKQAEEHKVRAFAEAERAKSEAIAEAETNKYQAIAEAEQAKREALADVEEARRDAEQARLDTEQARRDAEQAKLEALADIEDARREALADAEEAKREAMIASKQHYNLSNVISSGKNTSVSTTIDKNGTKRIVSTAGNATVTTIIEKNGNKTTISKIGDKVSVVRNNP